MAEVPAHPVQSAADARVLFDHVVLWLKRARLYYNLRDFPYMYVSCVLDLSEAYRYLAFYVVDLDERYDVQRKRSDVLEALGGLLKEVKPQCYVAVSVELLRELAEVQIEMLGLNMRRMWKPQGEHDGTWRPGGVGGLPPDGRAKWAGFVSIARAKYITPSSFPFFLFPSSLRISSPSLLFPHLPSITLSPLLSPSLYLFLSVSPYLFLSLLLSLSLFLSLFLPTPSYLSRAGRSYLQLPSSPSLPPSSPRNSSSSLLFSHLPSPTLSFSLFLSVSPYLFLSLPLSLLISLFPPSSLLVSFPISFSLSPPFLFLELVNRIYLLLCVSVMRPFLL